MDDFNFDLAFGFLNETRSSLLPESDSETAPPQVPCPPQPQIQCSNNFDIKELAARISNVNDLVVQIKNLESEKEKLQKQLVNLDQSVSGVKSMYEKEKSNSDRLAVSNSTLSEQLESTRNELLNRNHEYEQLKAQSSKKQMVSYDSLCIGYLRAVKQLEKYGNKFCINELEQIQDIRAFVSELYNDLEKSNPLKRSIVRTKLLENGFISPKVNFKADKEVECKIPVKPKCTEAATQCALAPTAVAKETRTQGTQYISSTTTRGTCTSAFIKKHSVGTNFPEVIPMSVDDILKEMIFNVSPISAIEDLELPEAPQPVVEKKSVSTCTDLRNVRLQVDYVPISVKKSDSRPPSRTMLDNIKKETSNPAVNIFGNAETSDLWNLLGQTIFALIRNGSSQINQSQLNLLNERMEILNRNLQHDEQQQQQQPIKQFYEPNAINPLPPVPRSPELILNHIFSNVTSTNLVNPASNNSLQEDTSSNLPANEMDCDSMLSADSVNMDFMTSNVLDRNSPAESCSESSFPTPSNSHDVPAVESVAAIDFSNVLNRIRPPESCLDTEKVLPNLVEEETSEAKADVIASNSRLKADDVSINYIAVEIETEEEDSRGTNDVETENKSNDVVSCDILEDNTSAEQQKEVLSCSVSSETLPEESELKSKEAEPAHKSIMPPIQRKKRESRIKPISTAWAKVALTKSNEMAKYSEVSTNNILRIPEETKPVDMQVTAVDEILKLFGSSNENNAIFKSPYAVPQQISETFLCPQKRRISRAPNCNSPAKKLRMDDETEVSSVMKNSKSLMSELFDTDSDSDSSESDASSEDETSSQSSSEDGDNLDICEQDLFISSSDENQVDSDPLDEDVFVRPKNVTPEPRRDSVRHVGVYDDKTDERTESPMLVIDDSVDEDGNEPVVQSMEVGEQRAEQPYEQNMEDLEEGVKKAYQNHETNGNDQKEEILESPASPVFEASANSHPLIIPTSPTRRPHLREQSNSIVRSLIRNFCEKSYKTARESSCENLPTSVKFSNFVQILDSYLHGPEDVNACLQNALSKSPDVRFLAKAIVASIEKSLDLEINMLNTPPAPPLPMAVQKAVIYIFKLKDTFHTIDRLVVEVIEDRLFAFKSEIMPLESLTTLTYLYIGIIGAFSGDRSPARLFICNCMYFYNMKSIPMIYQILKAYPGVMPIQNDPAYDRSDALINTIQCLLMTTFFDVQNLEMKNKQLFTLLRNYYKYDSGKPSKPDLVKNLVAKIRVGNVKNVPYALALVCKRHQQSWAESNILNAHLMPLANEFYHSIAQTEEHDSKIACLLESISFIVKPFALKTDVTVYLNLFQSFFNSTANTNRKLIQEAAVRSIIRLSRFGYVNCFNLIVDFNPSFSLDTTTRQMLKSFIYKKKYDLLKKLERQCCGLMSS